MTEDASLDQFASSEASETDDDDSADSEPVESESNDSETSEEADGKSEDVEKQSEESANESDASPAVEPAISTFTWSSEGGECADCGASVERRWRSDGQRDGNLVCADCKEW